MSNSDNPVDPHRRNVLSAVTGLSTAMALGLSAPRTTQAAADVPPSSVRKLRTVALEEHFLIPAFRSYFEAQKQNIKPELWNRVLPILEDFDDGRLETMDQNGVDFAVLSLTGPGVQIEQDTAVATRMARQVNDALAQQVHRRPNRYGGFAHLAMQDPAGAASELERCIKSLGFQGAMINGATNGVYLDDRRHDVFWERVQALDVPIYLHPANPFDRPAMYADHPELWGPTWSWAAETCTHFLRLLFSGLFDRYPQLKIVLGHMGETIPIQPWRLDSRYVISNQRYSIQKKPSEYIRENLYITTSGVCADPALRCALDAVGIDKVMFSIDYPFEHTDLATSWIRSAQISESERAQVSYQTATRLMRL